MQKRPFSNDKTYVCKYGQKLTLPACAEMYQASFASVLPLMI